MIEKVEFPFEPNEKVKAAFRYENKRKVIVEIMTKSLADVFTDNLTDPFELLRKEHPEVVETLKDYKKGLAYNYITQTIDIK